MLRQSQLPPRVPTQRKPAGCQLDECTSLGHLDGSKSSIRHRKSFSQGSAPEDHSEWLNDLLTDLNTSPRGIFHCRSASDSAALLDNFASHVRHSGNDDESSASDESGNLLVRNSVYGPNSPRGKVSSDFKDNFMLTDFSGNVLTRDCVYGPNSPRGKVNSDVLDSCMLTDESGNVLARDCVYGPNSPRGKVDSDFLESSMLTALSDYTSQIKIPSVEEEAGWCGGPDQFDLEGDEHGSTEELNAESMTGKRHPRQRSRARKLQYIAKLERTVNALQALESELAFKVSALAQQRVNLSVENRSLKQQMAMLRNRKLMMDREHQLLNKEAELLRFRLAKTNSRNTTQNHRLIDAAEDSWNKNLDWAKLNLG